MILNDGHIPHSLLPVDTLFFQIAGRLRNSIYRDYIINIFSPTKNTDDMTYGEYAEASERAFKEAEEYASGIKIVKTEEAYPERPIKEAATKKTSFKDAFKAYCKLKAARSLFPIAEQILIEKHKPLVRTAYDTLGESKVKALKYKVTDIRRELVKASTVTETEKIIRMVK